MVIQMKRIISKSVLFYCVLFTGTTIISSIFQLAVQAQEFDSNSHILNRAIIVLIGVCAFQMVKYSNFKIKALNIVVPYCVSMGLVFLYVFFTGFFEELHPNAYRDIFLNYTIIFAVVFIVVTVFERLKRKKD